jgi:outer membrane protein
VHGRGSSESDVTTIKESTMRTVQWAVVLAAAIFFTPISAEAADVAKIGVFDFQKILESSSAGKAAQAEINKKGKKMESDLKVKGNEIEKLRQQLEREALVMNRDMRAEKEREVRIKINDIKTLQRQYMADFKEKEKRLLLKIQKEIREIVKAVGKKEGYLLILENREAGIFYAPSSIDVTDEIIKRYNSQFADSVSKSGASKKQ